MWTYCLAIVTGLAPTVSEPPSDLRCGSYCLYVALKALDVEIGSHEELEQRLGQPSGAGYSLGQLKEAAESYGAQTLGVQTSIENLRRRPGRFACIAHVRGNHFLTITDIHGREARIIDPPREYSLPADTLRSQWDGTALLISNVPLIHEEDLPRQSGFWTWAGVVVSLLAVLGVGMLIARRRREPIGG